MLKRDAVAIMKAALAGTKTSRFTDIMEAAFIDKTRLPQQTEDPIPEEDDVDILEDPEEQPEQPQPTTSTLSASLKRKLPPMEEPPSKKASVCSFADAEPFYPSVNDKDKYLHCGVDSKFISDRILSRTSKAAGYCCKFLDASKEEGKIVPSSEWFSTTKAQLSTHLRQFHLGVAVTCFVCRKQWWAASTWFKHMKAVHTALTFYNYFFREGAEAELEMQTLLIKQEVAQEDI